MIVLGLTGSIGMGKSTAAAMLGRMGLPVHDADAAVHSLMTEGGEAVAAVEAAFPGVTRDRAVDRRALGQRVFGDAAALKRLEGILHPLVTARTVSFLKLHRRRRTPLVVLDVPLLLEGRSHLRCDLVAVVSAPAFLQRIRVLARPGMTAATLDSILSKQMPDRDKRARADVVIPTGLGRAFTRRRLARLIHRLRREGSSACVKSSLTRRRRALTPRRATNLSRSAVSS
ncbi:MAG: dephospho-CoA kinase [Alphaproteobacteria bacterium]|nr:dephospho-CoA kinase [Alphaproteobacteria bacterium]